MEPTQGSDDVESGPRTNLTGWPGTVPGIAPVLHGSTTLDNASARAANATPGPANRQPTANSNALQPRLLKQINSLDTKQDLLTYVARCHTVLDVINLVTCLYRLARAFSFMPAGPEKARWRTELITDPTFNLLLNCIQQQLLTAQAPGAPKVQGLNARCLSNLIWALVKLEVAEEDGHPLAAKMVVTASPLVIGLLEECSGQGLSNLLWSLSKVDEAPPDVMIALVTRLTGLLRAPPPTNALDVQGMSNSMWAIAHVSERLAVTPQGEEWQACVARFLVLVANLCLTLMGGAGSGGAGGSGGSATSAAALGGVPGPNNGVTGAQLGTSPGSAGNSGSLMNGPRPVMPDGLDNRVSCQAIANIAWSFSSVLGSACGEQEPVRSLFLLIRTLCVAKLVAPAGVPVLAPGAGPGAAGPPLVGSFNESALANLVSAFDTAGLLTADLLQAVLDTAAARLTRATIGASNAAASGGGGGGNNSANPQGPLGFKPQELVILLRACHLGLGQPWAFLRVLARLAALHPHLLTGWTHAEQGEVQAALRLLEAKLPELAPSALDTSLVTPPSAGSVGPAGPPALSARPSPSPVGPQFLATIPGARLPHHAPYVRPPAGQIHPHASLTGDRLMHTVSDAAAMASSLGLDTSLQGSGNTMGGVLAALGQLQLAPLPVGPQFRAGTAMPLSAPQICQTLPAADHHLLSQSTAGTATTQQVWLRGPDGSLQAATIVLSQPGQGVGLNSSYDGIMNSHSGLLLSSAPHSSGMPGAMTHTLSSHHLQPNQPQLQAMQTMPAHHLAHLQAPAHMDQASSAQPIPQHFTGIVQAGVQAGGGGMVPGRALSGSLRTWS